MPSSSGGPPRVKVSDADRREIFAKGQFLSRLKNAELTEKVLSQRQPRSGLPPNCPPGTWSQSVAYLEGRRVVAIVHQYKRPDGTLGAWGRPDPKYVVWEGVAYCL